MGSWGPFLEILPAILPFIITEGKDRKKFVKEAKGTNSGTPWWWPKQNEEIASILQK